MEGGERRVPEREISHQTPNITVAPNLENSHLTHTAVGRQSSLGWLWLSIFEMKVVFKFAQHVCILGPETMFMYSPCAKHSVLWEEPMGTHMPLQPRLQLRHIMSTLAIGWSKSRGYTQPLWAWKRNAPLPWIGGMMRVVDDRSEYILI
jgi:hypothetical protein